MKESQIQSQLIAWWRVAHKGLGVADARLLMMIPNGSYFGGGFTARGQSLGAIRFANLKRQGFVQGAPDLFLAVPRGQMASACFHGGLWLEMKTAVGRLAPAQKELHGLLHAQGYAVVTAYSFEEGVDAITTYLAHALKQTAP